MSGILTKRGARARLAGVAALLVALAAAGCGGDDVGRAVNASVTLDLPDSLPGGSPFDVGYVWTPADDFEPPAGDYRVFVHFVDPDGNIVQQDDHYPPVPTSQWKAGETVTYRRWVYPDPDVEPDYFDIYVGLYDENEPGQVATLAEGSLQPRPLVHSVIMRNQDQAGVPVFVEGFQERETSLTIEDPHAREWRWMQQRGVVAFGNPHGPSTLHLRALSPVDFLGGTQTVVIKMGEQEVARFEVTDSSPYLMRFDVPDSGEGDWVELTLEVDKTFVPAQVEPGSEDIRELGLQIFWMYLAR